MWPFKKKDKTKLTYQEEHNKAYNAFKKASRIGIWAGVLCVIGLLTAIAQQSQIGMFNLFLCFGSVDFIICLFLSNSLLTATPWFYILSFLIAISVSALFILLSVFASQGKKIPLILMVILYFIDMIFIIPMGLMGLESTGNLWLSIGVHTVIIVFMFIALYEYFNIIKIAQKYGIVK